MLLDFYQLLYEAHIRIDKNITMNHTYYCLKYKPLNYEANSWGQEHI